MSWKTKKIEEILAAIDIWTEIGVADLSCNYSVFWSNGTDKIHSNLQTQSTSNVFASRVLESLSAAGLRTVLQHTVCIYSNRYLEGCRSRRIFSARVYVWAQRQSMKSTFHWLLKDEKKRWSRLWRERIAISWKFIHDIQIIFWWYFSALLIYAASRARWLVFLGFFWMFGCGFLLHWILVDEFRVVKVVTLTLRSGQNTAGTREKGRRSLFRRIGEAVAQFRWKIAADALVVTYATRFLNEADACHTQRAEWNLMRKQCNSGLRQ